ncbi:hypothetical protein AYI68_g5941 [Smittium mucronatum]|uniref:Uncharacterized protein n=1 Tax=Smittium mucronatum TaxID=133383 RepID=A0A1R0GSW3_9FUNG|nr:hypothetical protein AYI68_g5941 [Smittium mucronatum]
MTVNKTPSKKTPSKSKKNAVHGSPPPSFLLNNPSSPNFVCTVGNEVKSRAINPAVDYFMASDTGAQAVEFYNIQAYPFYESNIKPVAVATHDFYSNNIKPTVLKVAEPALKVVEYQISEATIFASEKYQKSKLIKPFVDTYYQKAVYIYDTYIHPNTVLVVLKTSNFFEHTVYPNVVATYNQNIKPFYYNTFKPFWIHHIQPGLKSLAIKIHDFTVDHAIPFIRKYSGVILDHIEYFLEFQLPRLCGEFVNLLNPWYSDTFVPMINSVKRDHIDPYFVKFPVLNVFIEVPRFLLQFSKEIYYIFYEALTGKQNKVLKERRLERLKKVNMNHNQKHFSSKKKAESKNLFVDSMNFDQEWLRYKLHANAEIAAGGIQKAFSWLFSKTGEVLSIAKKTFEDNTNSEPNMSSSSRKRVVLKPSSSPSAPTSSSDKIYKTVSSQEPVEQKDESEHIFSIQTGVNDEINPEEYLSIKSGEISHSQTPQANSQEAATDEAEFFEKELLKIQHQAEVLNQKLNSLKKKSSNQNEVHENKKVTETSLASDSQSVPESKSLESDANMEPAGIHSDHSEQKPISTDETVDYSSESESSIFKPSIEKKDSKIKSPEPVVEASPPLESVKNPEPKNVNNDSSSSKTVEDSSLLIVSDEKNLEFESEKVILNESSQIFAESSSNSESLSSEGSISTEPVPQVSESQILESSKDEKAAPSPTPESVVKTSQPADDKAESIENLVDDKKLETSSIGDSSSKANKLEDFVIVRNENDENLGADKDRNVPFEKTKKDPKKAASDWVKEAKQSISKEMAENRSRNGATKVSSDSSVKEDDTVNTKEPLSETSSASTESAASASPTLTSASSSEKKPQVEIKRQEIPKISTSNESKKPIATELSQEKVADKDDVLKEMDHGKISEIFVDEVYKGQSAKPIPTSTTLTSSKDENSSTQEKTAEPEIRSTTRAIKVIKRKKKSTQ